MAHMTRIHIFNPDTDYALASGLNFYTPPARIAALRQSMALFPLSFANPGDAILCLDPVPDGGPGCIEGYHEASRRGTDIYFPVTEPDRYGHPVTRYRHWITGDTPPAESEILPWGWNAALRRHLADSGFQPSRLPSPERIRSLRELSHRRTTVTFNRMLADAGLTAEKGCDCVIPCELHDTESVLGFVALHPDSYLKAPWSSSGRGVIRTGDLEERHIRPWASGILRRQGAVMAEPTAERVLDFATEWHCRDGHAHFAGLSVFDTSRRGKYIANRHGSHSSLSYMISEAAPGWSGLITDAQRHAIETLIAPGYDGPLGIDMLVDDRGMIRPCIEINLRMTMGMATLMADARDGS